MKSKIDIKKYLYEFADNYSETPVMLVDNVGGIIWCNRISHEFGAKVGINCKNLFGDDFDIEKICSENKNECEIQVKNVKFSADIPAKFDISIEVIRENEELIGAMLICKCDNTFEIKQTKLLFHSFNSLFFPIVIADENEKIIYINPVAQSYFEQINSSPKNLDEVAETLGYPDNFINKIHNHLDNNGFYSFQTFSARIKGRYFEHKLFKLLDDDKKHIGYIIASSDITEHLRISERKQQVLKQEFLERFSSKVFHKLNNQFLLVMADDGLIRRELPKNVRAKVQNHLNELEDHIMGASEIVQLLSLFVRPPKQQHDKIDIIEFLENRITSIMGSIPRSVEFSVELPDSDVIVNCYLSLMDKIFEAIFDNAIRALSDKGGRIMVSGESIQPDEIFLMNYPELSDIPYFKISIADTGIGIDEKKMSKIFEPFFSGWKIKSRGLGLSMALSAMRHHNGTIDIQSTADVGTTVSLFFPVQSTEKLIQKIPSEKNENNVILLIDDDDCVRKALAQMLETLDYVPISASSGSEGIDLFAKVKPDMVMLDMIMPDIPGEKVFEKLKQINPDCPVIVATAYAQIESVEELIENGVEYILQKPFTINQLSITLDKILNR